jgi:type II secretory pathway pseudopilin PulG
MIGMVILGVVLLAIMGVFTLFQKSATRTTQFAGAQQNARIAVDFLTEYLRLAGSGTDYVRGQPHIVHAGPYQVGMNADIDNGETLSGDPPLVAIEPGFSICGGNRDANTRLKQRRCRVRRRSR